MGSEILASRIRRVPNWKDVSDLVLAARQKLAGDRERLMRLLTESRRRLGPLEDPFDVDLGLHRWLAPEREESYSDWLEWIVRQIKDPAQVFSLFALPGPPARVIDCPECEVQRECCIPYGHPDQEGRLDLVIRYGDKALVVVEVKKSDAEGADTLKHDGYRRWLTEQTAQHKFPVLLALSGEEADYEEFRLVSWASVCVEMRRLAVYLCKQDRLMTAAIVLAFVAAVEQNLLGYSAGVVQGICKGDVTLFNSAIVDHLEEFIEKLET
jgi:hypothetical protein